MKKPTKPATLCPSTASGGVLKCVLEAGHAGGIHSSNAGKSRQYATWALDGDGRIKVTTFSSKRKDSEWTEDPPVNVKLAAVGYCGAKFESFARADDTCVLTAGHDGGHENTSTGTREKCHEHACVAHRECDEAARRCGCAECKAALDAARGIEPAPPKPKKVSKIYTEAERAQIERKEAPPAASPSALKVHPAADALPLIEGAEFDALVDDIRTNGLRHKPVIDHSGFWLVDGRNRKRACEQLGIVIEYERLPEGTNIAAFVISTNLKRRHLTESQRAMIASEIANLSQGRPNKTGPGAGLSEGVTQAEAAAGAGVGERTVRRANAVHDQGVPELVAAVKSGKVDLKGAEQVAKLSPKKQREIVKKHIEPAKSPVRAGKLAAHAKQEEKREVVRAINEQNVAPAPMGPFGVIVIDPPWPYENSDQHEGSRGHIDYPPMSIQAICNLGPDLDARAKDDCILGMWVTNAFVHEVGRILFAWGFDHRTVITWDKEIAGMGTLPRGQTEHLIIATRGAPVHTLNEITTLLRAKRREHSRKPDEMYELLAKHCSGPMIDMFSREQREGWATWGAETSKFATEAA